MPYHVVMTFDSYHGDSYNRALGFRISGLLPDQTISVRCDRCGRAFVADHGTFKNFRPDTPITHLYDALTVFCRARKEGGACEAEFDAPQDVGVGD